MKNIRIYIPPVLGIISINIKSVEGLLFTLGWEGDKKRKKETDRVKR